MTRKQERTGLSLDEVSKAIIEQLQQDGRRSYAAIGKVVGLSEAAVRQRVQRLAELEEIDYVVITAGSYDLLAEVVCESDEALLDLISHRIRNIPGVVATETFMYLKLRKQTYSWGVR